MGDKSIPDSQITASSEYGPAYAATNARLGHVAGNGKTGSWTAKTQNIGQWIEVDLGDITKVTKIGTQGRQEAGWWVTEYKMSYSWLGGYFVFYKSGPYSAEQVSLQGKLSWGSRI
ncbi:hypothetical protein OS493_025130 [Desmophyllum pertusum]|uniref:F5/8 type C domain-containing protein n=1 Tax=Desmophyllum pertusum TaxID=174260 RepID=A0A9X0D8G2_9CNID|nr:hypothetical protein OS493_025130 [Desmophyllum pertusum]